MFIAAGNNASSTTTSHKVVLPFYLYAGIAFLIATILLFFSSRNISSHYFQPHTLAIIHIMALGWGTMIILGASHQLVPVLIEGSLYSNKLALASFILAAAGIPLLAFGFYNFNMKFPAQCGGELVVASVFTYVVNIAASMKRSGHSNVHAYFIITAALWLLITTIVGLLLVYNFTYSFLPDSSVLYLPLHAHLGIAGWFLLLVTGTGSRLIPLFLISKYNNKKQLWWIYGLVNGALLVYIFIFFASRIKWLQIIPLAAVAIAVLIFGNFCYRSYRERIRKKVDEQMKVSLLSVMMMALPFIFLIAIIILLAFSPAGNTDLVIVYGFIIFFGWLTAIILGMTFKTLPFIVWNKVYHHLAGKGKTPNPKDLFSNRIFKFMSVAYISGFVVFIAGIFLHSPAILQLATILLLLASFSYNWNLLKLLMHKPVVL
jgi:hypothetical protein